MNKKSYDWYMNRLDTLSNKLNEFCTRINKDSDWTYSVFYGDKPIKGAENIPDDEVSDIIVNLIMSADGKLKAVERIIEAIKQEDNSYLNLVKDLLL